MNPYFVGFGWIMTMLFIGLLVTGSGGWWIPLAAMGAYYLLGLLSD